MVDRWAGDYDAMFKNKFGDYVFYTDYARVEAERDNWRSIANDRSAYLIQLTLAAQRVVDEVHETEPIRKLKEVLKT